MCFKRPGKKKFTRWMYVKCQKRDIIYIVFVPLGTRRKMKKYFIQLGLCGEKLCIATSS